MSSTDASAVLPFKISSSTGRLLTDSASSGGTVTSVSVATANGFAGSVANPTTTPAITLTTTVTGVLKGNGTAISAATDGTDYLSPTTGITVSQSTPQTLGVTGSRLLKLWATDITVTNAIVGSITGNAATAILAASAIALATGRTISISGDMTYASPAFDGTANVTAAGTLATVNSNVGTFGSATAASVVTVNAKGLVTAASSTTVTPAVGSITGLGTNVATFLATPSSANLASALTDETGTGVAVFNAKPTFVGTIQTVTAMGAQALDGSTANVFTRTLAGSETFTQSNFSTGQCFMAEVKQGSGTSYTVTWFAGVTWVTSGGTAPVQTTISNGYTTYGFRCTGSNTFLGYLIGTN